MPLKAHISRQWRLWLLAWLLLTFAQPTEAKAAPIVATWQGITLGELVTALTPLIGRPLVLDCRVDPTTRITLSATGQEPAAVLAEVATLAEAEVVILRESVRLAPPRRRAALQAAEEQRSVELSEGSTVWQRVLTQRRPAEWAAAATPHDVVVALTTAADIPVSGLERIPHDHLQALNLPAMSVAAQLDLVLASYDLRSAITAEGLEIVALDPTAQPQRPPQLPPATSRPRPRMPAAGTSTFTLEAAAPLDQLLTAIADQTGLTLQLNTTALQASGINPARVVRVAVKNASLEELLDAIAKPHGLRWEIAEQKLSVTAGSTPPAREPGAGEPPRG